MSNGFVVDTHLLRELGDLLVGRDSTALVELIKNGYDADASLVRVGATRLDTPEAAELTVEDDGNGMTLERFQDAFLRIAGRAKETGARRSPRFGRAYTGQKGIGRLASQKLANVLEVSSQPNGQAQERTGQGVHALIEWDVIDQQETLDNIEFGLEVAGVPLSDSVPHGTTMTLQRLKRRWGSQEIATFVQEIQSAQPPNYLLRSGSDTLGIADVPLFGAPVVRQTADEDPGFRLELTGDLAFGDDLWDAAANDFSWSVEIEVLDGKARYQLTPTAAYIAAEPLARTHRFERGAPAGLKFQARFFVLVNASVRRGPLQGFVRSNSGLRVYYEGFRVLPYGEHGDDWLGIDRDYRTGTRYYTIDLEDQSSDSVEVDEREALSALATTAYYGAVFLTTEGSQGLQSLINREGFVPGPTFEAIRSIVQDGVRLSVRVRRSVMNQRAALEALLPSETPARPNDAPTPTDTEPSTNTSAATPSIASPQERLPYGVLADRRPSREARAALAAATAAARRLSEDYSSSVQSQEIKDLIVGVDAAHERLQNLESIQPDLRALAGVGLQLGAFVHDINGMLASTTTIRTLLAAALETTTDRQQRVLLQSVLRSAEELAHMLARQSSYLTDVLSTDPRRRRSRSVLVERLESTLRFLNPRIAARQIEVHLNVPNTLRVPPMFPSETTILLTNLLTNAVKNAADGGNIWIDAVEGDAGRVVMTISNDGVVVDLNEAERWFLPFESTTTSVDEVLGQGLGLGLPIVRAIVDDYGGEVHFVATEHEPGTAVRVVLQERKSRRG